MNKAFSDIEEQAAKKVHEIVLEHFGSWVTTMYWWSTPNPMLGNKRPLDMVISGRGPRLLKAVQSWKDGDF